MEAKAAFEHAVTRAARQHPYLADHPPLVEWWGGQFAPAQSAEDTAVFTTTASALAAVTGTVPRVEGMTYGADMRLLVNDGGVPTLLFGPGNVRHAHRPDEFVPIADLMTAARVLALTALRFGDYQR